MKELKLLPETWQVPGWVLLIIGSLGGLFTLFTEQVLEWHITMPAFFVIGGPLSPADTGAFLGWTTTEVTDEIAGLMVIAGGLIVGLCRQAREDEFIAFLRLRALIWALIINYGLLVFFMVFTYDFTFYWVMVIGMFSMLLLFVGRFYFLLFYLRKQADS
jgi:hypothetical protein